MYNFYEFSFIQNGRPLEAIKLLRLLPFKIQQNRSVHLLLPHIDQTLSSQR